MRRSLRMLMDLMPPSRRLALPLICAMMLLNGLLELVSVGSLLPLAAISSEPSGHSPFGLGLAFLLAFLLARLCSALTLHTICRLCARLRHEIAHKLLLRTLARPYTWYLGRHCAELAQAVQGDADDVVDGFLMRLAETVVGATVAVFIILGLLWLAPVLTLTLSCVLGLGYALLHALVAGPRTRGMVESWRIRQRRGQGLWEALASVRETRTCLQREHLVARFDAPSQELITLTPRLRLLGDIPTRTMEALAVTCIVGIWIFQTGHEASSSAVMARVLVSIMAFWRLVPALDDAFTNFGRMWTGLPALERVHATLGEPAPFLEPPAPRPLEREIRLKEVSWTYPGAARPALSKVNLTVPRGGVIGLVGRTGAGKTTLVDILAGLLPPSQGCVLLDGQPLDAPAWIGSVGYVPQEVFLIDDTVASNIAFGLPPAQIDPAALERAARLARAHEFITQLPEGYATVVEERGQRLSGGQRQRIGLARALYRNPALLILDESTSALDVETEQEVLSELAQLRGTLTMLVISHRSSALELCDAVYLVESGQVEKNQGRRFDN